MKLFSIISISTLVWVIVTFLTGPVEKEKLINFYKRTLPGGYGWNPVKKFVGDMHVRESFASQFVQWINGSMLVVAVTLGIGKALLGFYSSAIIWFMIAAVSTWYFFRKFIRS